MKNHHILPTAYIVGAQKSGTTTIYNWLSQHPDIYGNQAAKDFPFFSELSLYQKGEKELSKYFHKKQQQRVVLGGEASLMYESGAVARLYATIPNSLVIVILRNPVERCFSSWRYAIERGIETRSFDEAIAEELAGCKYSEAWQARQKDYLKHSRYSKQLEEIYEYFPRSKVKLLLYDDLVHRPHKMVKIILEFLEVNREFTPDLTIKNKTRGGMRSTFLGKILYKNRARAAFASRILRKITSTGIRMRIRESLISFNRVEAPTAQLEANLKIKLIKYFGNEINYLEKELKVELGGWKE